MGASATQGLVQDLFIKERMNEDVSNLLHFWSVVLMVKPREALLKFADKKDDEESK